MNNWPYPDKPGVPLNPERDGWHWLKHPEDLHPVMLGWISELQGWSFGRRHSPKGIVDMGYQYLGSILLPAEVAAQVEQARRQGAEAMREVCAAYVMCGCDTAEQARVVAAATTEGPNSAARWRSCHRSDCLALMAAEVLDLPLPGDIK